MPAPRPRQDPNTPYRYFVATDDSVKLRVKAIGTAHMLVEVLDQNNPPPPPTETKVPPWVEYDFVVDRQPGDVHLLRCQYSFSNEPSNDPRYVHELVIKGAGQPCKYVNIPDMAKGNPLPVNNFRFHVVSDQLVC